MKVRKTATSLNWRAELEWQVHTAGYELREADQEWFLVGKNGPIKRYRLSDLESRKNSVSAFTDFANLEVPGGALGPERLISFANSYGIPGPECERDAIDIAEIKRSVGRIRAILGAVVAAKTATILLGNMPAGVSVRLEPERIMPSSIRKGRYCSDGLRPVFRVDSLQDFLWLQMLLAVTEGVRIKRCERCGDFMAAKTQKRNTCSDACRQSIYRKNQPPDEKMQAA
jgi:hypothetical protein